MQCNLLFIISLMLVLFVDMGTRKSKLHKGKTSIPCHKMILDDNDQWSREIFFIIIAGSYCRILPVYMESFLRRVSVIPLLLAFMVNTYSFLCISLSLSSSLLLGVEISLFMYILRGYLSLFEILQ